MLRKTSSGLRETASSRALGSRDVDKKLTSHTLGQVLHELGVDEIDDDFSDSDDDDKNHNNARTSSNYHQSQYEQQKQLQQQKQQQNQLRSLQSKKSFTGFEENAPMIRIQSQHTIRTTSMQNLHQHEQFTSPPPQLPLRQPSPAPPVKVVLPRRLSHQEMSMADPMNYSQPLRQPSPAPVASHLQHNGYHQNHANHDHHHQYHNNHSHHYNHHGQGHFAQNHSNNNHYSHCQNNAYHVDPQYDNNNHPNHYHPHQDHHLHQDHHNNHHHHNHHHLHNQDHDQHHPYHESPPQHINVPIPTPSQSLPHRPGHSRHNSHNSNSLSLPSNTVETKQSTVPFEENPMLLKKKPSVANMSEAAMDSSTANNNVTAVLKHFDPARLTEEDQVKLTLRLSKQESKYGTNMFEELQTGQVDMTEIETLGSFGFDFKDAVEKVFNERNDVVVTEVIKDDGEESELVSAPLLSQLQEPRVRQHVRRKSVSASLSMIDNPLQTMKSNHSRKPSGIPAIDEIILSASNMIIDDVTTTASVTTGSSSTSLSQPHQQIHLTAISSMPSATYTESFSSSSSFSGGPNAPLSPLLSLNIPSSSPHQQNYNNNNNTTSSGHTTYASTKSLSRTSSFQGNNGNNTTNSQSYEEQYSQNTINYTNYPNNNNSEYKDRYYDNNNGYTNNQHYSSHAHTASPERPPVSPASNARQLAQQMSPMAGVAPSHRRTNSNSLPPRQQIPPSYANNMNNNNFYANNNGGFVSSNSSVGSHRSGYEPYHNNNNNTNYNNISSSSSVNSSNYYGHNANASQPSSRIPSPAPSFTGPVPTSSTYRRTLSNSSSNTTLPMNMIQKMRIDALSRMSESDQLRISMLLSKQDEVHGINMFDSLTIEDQPNVDYWLSLGYKFEKIALFLFQQKHNAQMGDAPQMT